MGGEHRAPLPRLHRPSVCVGLPPGARASRPPPQKRESPFLGPRLDPLRAGRLFGVTDGRLRRGRGEAGSCVAGRISAGDLGQGKPPKPNRGLPSPRSGRIAFGKPARRMSGILPGKGPAAAPVLSCTWPGRKDRFPKPACSSSAFTSFCLCAPPQSESGSPPNPTAPSPALPRFSPPGRTPTKP